MAEQPHDPFTGSGQPLDFELAIERHIAAPPMVVWQVMTTRLTEWWCPKPWTTELVALDLVPGGRFATIMRGPDGEVAPHEGVVLEATPGRRLVFTDALQAGWMPHHPFMIGLFDLTEAGDGTLYRAAARHWSDEAMQQHKDMGFTEGWMAVADQLATLCEG